MIMSVEKALKRIANLVLTKGESFEDAQAWDTLRSHIERELTVSDVDKAVIVFYGSKHVGSSDYAAMQAALIAALEGK